MMFGFFLYNTHWKAQRAQKEPWPEYFNLD